MAVPRAIGRCTGTKGEALGWLRTPGRAGAGETAWARSRSRRVRCHQWNWYSGTLSRWQKRRAPNPLSACRRIKVRQKRSLAASRALPIYASPGVSESSLLPGYHAPQDAPVATVTLLRLLEEP